MQAGSNYIYIIFAIVYVIYSIIKAGKKVTQNRPTIDPQSQSSPTVQPPTATPPPQQDFKKMLEDLLGGVQEEKIPTSPPTPLPQERGVTTPKPLRKESIEQPVKITLHNTPKKETATVSHANPLSAKPHKVSEKASYSQQYETAKKVFAEPVGAEEPAVDFDIRQAIIYSEILKRPNW